jgi:hypothetical protein
MDLVADSVIGEDPETCQNQQKRSQLRRLIGVYETFQ